MNKEINIDNKLFQLGKQTYIMGILNVTPDSFSDGGNFVDFEKAVNHAKEMVLQGADIIDIGGESTRPNHIPVSEEEEIKRVVPIIKALRQEVNVPLSVDTYKAKVAECSILEGVSLINDIWGFKKDKEMAKVAAKYNTACCLMHNRENNNYNDIMSDMIMDLRESINLALSAGVKENKIIIDPGIGFAKDYEQNLEVMNKLEMLGTLGYPVLLATSKKSMIGNALNLPPKERGEGTLATTVIGIMKNCDFIRVHDIKENKRVCMMTDAIVRK